jgi:hypothetical protein
VTSFRLLVLAPVAFALGCQDPTSYPNGLEYLKAEGFGPNVFAQVRSETEKNINDQVPALLDMLRESEMVPERRIVPFFTIYLESGSSSPSQVVSIQIGIDGYGVMQHVHERAYFYCSELPRFAEAAFNQSTIVVH